MTDDVLGPGWTAQTLPLRPDGRTPDPVATLVHRTGSPSRRALLYVHGFVDYFFHTQFGDALAAHGYDVYALDLRDYGRSIRDGRPPNHVTDLGAFAEEIDAAIRIIRADHDEVVLLGHSMGGLVTSLWADSRRGRAPDRRAGAQQPVAGPARLLVQAHGVHARAGRRREGRPGPRRRRDRLRTTAAPCTRAPAASGRTTSRGSRTTASRPAPGSAGPSVAATRASPAAWTSTSRSWSWRPTPPAPTTSGTTPC